MFTGIIEELGLVAAFEPREAGARLRVKCRTVLEGLQEGTSISVNGVCLTARDISQDSFAADLAPETLARSNLGALIMGSRVNLERPVTPATLLSGHIVQGHVDATGEILSLEPLGNGNAWLKVKAPAQLDRYLVEKGSVSLDGISLTIAALERHRAGVALAESGNSPESAAPSSVVPRISADAGPIIGVAVIPHTLANTTLGSARPGGRVNIEVDVLAKYVEKLVAAGQA